jgi:hypothetical protein
VEILTECPKCKAGLPLNGPRREVECANCLSSLTLEDDFWDLLADSDKSYREGHGGYTLNFTTDFQWKVSRPKCHACNAELSIEGIAVGTDGPITCPACNATNHTFPAPQWLRRVVPRIEQLYGAERDDTDGGSGDVALQPENESKPIAMACPKCGGGLTVTAEMDRTITCEYCETDVFLPDALWKRLHPVKTSNAWFVRLAARP